MVPPSVPPSLSLIYYNRTKPFYCVNAKSLSMPGTKVKAAAALNQNVAYLAREFGLNRVGFLTLTVGDWRDGRFVGICDRAEAEKRFHRAMRHIAGRYQCGVTVTERMKSAALHWHLVVVLGADIRTGVDFEAFARGDYRSAPSRLRLEWAWWRSNAPRFGLGRHELLPIRHNGDALGNYVGKYIGKGWAERTADDKGARTVRYFGHWGNCPIPVCKKTGRKMPWRPPFSLRYCACSARAGAWREAMHQVQLITKLHGLELHQDNIKSLVGARWAWRITQTLRLFQFFTHRRRLHPLYREGLDRHNAEAGSVHHVGNSNLDHWIPSAWRDGFTLTEQRAWHRFMDASEPMPTTEELK